MGAKGAARTAVALVVLVVVVALPTIISSCGSPWSGHAEPVVVSVHDVVQVNGLEVQVTGAHRADAIGNGLEAGNFLLVPVALTSSDGLSHPYGPQDWRFEARDGSMLAPIALSDDDRLQFGTLEAGGRAEGQVAFDLGDRDPAGRVWYLVADQPFVGWDVFPVATVSLG